MTVRSTIKPSQYHDSVTLMEMARELSRLPGVLDAAAVMGTEANKGILRQAGMLLPEIEAAGANDLVIAVRAEAEGSAAHALQVAEEQLQRRPQAGPPGAALPPRSIRSAVAGQPGANLAVISVPGPYAAAEAWDALRRGLHVLLFSDNVPLQDEVALKRYADQHALLLMGPDCGTAILNGVALGFANVVPRGPVGIVAAAGTGLQEASSLLARLGIGLSQGIGTGGRDLSDEVGGLTMLQGIRTLQADPQTQVLLLVSKPPASAVVKRVLDQVKASPKPTVICFLGGDPAPVAAAGAIPAATLQEAALLAAEQVKEYEGPSARQVIAQDIAALQRLAHQLTQRLTRRQRYSRGLYSGGTLAAEALLLWSQVLPTVYSNVAGDRWLTLPDATRSQGHCVVDLGADQFTIGRPHPMLDHDLRIRRLLQEAADPEVALLLLDLVLGYGAHPDPAVELGPGIRQARARAAEQGQELLVVASVTGTEQDPQRLGRQRQALEAAGAVIASCNAAAARLAALVVQAQTSAD